MKSNTQQIRRQADAIRAGILKAAPGDTIKFVPVNLSHNAETIPDMWPEGAEKFKGDLNKEVVLKVDEEGVYGVKCLPHYMMVW